MRNPQTLFGSRVGNITKIVHPPLSLANKIRKAKTRQRLDMFAEHLSEDMSVNAAAAAVGWSKEHGHKQLGKMRKALGWQAQ